MNHFTAQLIQICHPHTRPSPADVRCIAQHSLLDWISVLVGGLDQPVTQIVLQEALDNGSAPQACVPGTPYRVSLRDAARINGTASHALDFDDTHLPSRVHPSTPLWPGILALAEELNVPGHRIIDAFIAGVELQSRLAAAFGESHYAAGWHNTATLGTFGSAFACGVLLELEPSQLAAALGIAASLTSGPRLQFGSDAKALQCGSAPSNGLFAARLAQRGLTAHPAIFDQSSGFIEMIATTSTRQIDSERWYTRDIVYKYHASCYGTQAPIAAALSLPQGAFPEGPIHVWIEPQYLSVCNIATPLTLNEARFSVRHMVAMALLGRDTVSESGLKESLLDHRVTQLRERIRVEADSNLARATSRIVFSNGATYRADMSQPEQDHQRQRQQLEQKSSRLLAGTFSSEQIARIHLCIAEIDSDVLVSALCSEVWLKNRAEYSVISSAPETAD